MVFNKMDQPFVLNGVFEIIKTSIFLASKIQYC